MTVYGKSYRRRLPEIAPTPFITEQCEVCLEARIIPRPDELFEYPELNKSMIVCDTCNGIEEEPIHPDDED